ncbi:MAG TPA: response regulator, partial [Bacteroidota bacterium]
MKKHLRVLIVEDSEDDTLLLTRELRQAGYEIQHDRVATQRDFTTALNNNPWDLILCDYTMPHFSGMKALYLLREKDDETPFIFVSGTISETTAIQAMKAGANDYVLKNNLKRFVPAVERELRDAEERRQKKTLEGNLRKSEERFRALIDNSADGIALVAADGSLLYESPSTSRISGYQVGE